MFLSPPGSWERLNSKPTLVSGTRFSAVSNSEQASLDSLDSIVSCTQELGFCEPRSDWWGDFLVPNSVQPTSDGLIPILAMTSTLLAMVSNPKATQNVQTGG